MNKKIIYVIFFLFFSQIVLAAGGDSGGGSSVPDFYVEAETIIKRAKKIDEKGDTEKAIKLFTSAYEKLLEADKKDKNNPDILNYLGFTLRKMGKYDEAEKYYLAGLKLKPDHRGINEYLGELYVKTKRIDLAKERLEVLKNCKCEEYEELAEVIKKN
jgi:tetratricopeptide (TPR) repeat protein